MVKDSQFGTNARIRFCKSWAAWRTGALKSIYRRSIYHLRVKRGYRIVNEIMNPSVQSLNAVLKRLFLLAPVSCHARDGMLPLSLPKPYCQTLPQEQQT